MCKFKSYLRHSSIKQDIIARSMKISQQAISQWCTGKSKPTIFQIQKLAKILNISTDEAINLFKQQEAEELAC